MWPQPGDIVGPFTLDYLLENGTTNNSLVFLAHMEGSCGKCAVKAIRTDVVGFQSAQDEFDFSMSISHPNIINYFPNFISEDRFPNFRFIGMKYYYYGDLFTSYESHHQWEERQVKVIMHKLFSAVGYLHGMGICHRDIKLENILIDDLDTYEDLVLADLGYCCYVDSEEMNCRKGTLYTAAPEILLEKPCMYFSIYFRQKIFNIIIFV